MVERSKEGAARSLSLGRERRRRCQRRSAHRRAELVLWRGVGEVESLYTTTTSKVVASNVAAFAAHGDRRARRERLRCDIIHRRMYT